MENKDIIPDHIIELYKVKHNYYPSILKTKNITNQGLTKLIENNSIEWLDSEFDGKKQNYLQGAINYGKTNILLFFKKMEHENIFTIKILYSLDDMNNVNLLLVGLNKYFTID